jgi:glycosyltransferase involved in cell wall biosynthesis
MTLVHDAPPLVSVVIPLHNHAKWIRDCVQSIIDQTYSNLQIVIMNDGSTDDYWESIKPLSNWDGLTSSFPCGKTFAKDIPISLHGNGPPRGPAWARNTGTRFSGDVFAYAFLDSDDLYMPTKIEKSIDILLKHDEVGAVYSDYYTFSANGAGTALTPAWKEPFSYERLLQECIINCDSVVRASAFKQVGGFDESMRVCEDYDFWVRMGETHLISHIAEPLVKIRIGAHSSSSIVDKTLWEKNWNRIREKMVERAKNHNGDK